MAARLYSQLRPQVNRGQPERGGAADAGGHSDKPPPRLRHGFDPPGQDLAVQRAVAKFGARASPTGEDRAGVGNCQREAVAEGDAHHAILREGVHSLQSGLALAVV